MPVAWQVWFPWSGFVSSACILWLWIECCRPSEVISAIRCCLSAFSLLIAHCWASGVNVDSNAWRWRTSCLAIALLVFSHAEFGHAEELLSGAFAAPLQLLLVISVTVGNCTVCLWACFGFVKLCWHFLHQLHLRRWVHVVVVICMRYYGLVPQCSMCTCG